VKDILKSLQIGKASGGDFISSNVKKYCRHCVLKTKDILKSYM
jgi:hypothetical protein